MTPRHFMKTLPLALVLAFISSVATAELPPSAYRERQANAPEHLEIRVLSVKTRETAEPRLVRVDVTANARVQRVHDSPDYCRGSRPVKPSSSPWKKSSEASGYFQQ